VCTANVRVRPFHLVIPVARYVAEGHCWDWPSESVAWPARKTDAKEIGYSNRQTLNKNNFSRRGDADDSPDQELQFGETHERSACPN